MEFDISVVVTAHREGILAHRTMQSIRAAAEQAAREGLRCEVLVMLDCADELTTEYFQSLEWEHLRLFFTDFGDPGPARNRGAREARGRFTAFVDGDDLIGRRWLVKAAELLSQRGGQSVAVPKNSIIFEAEWVCMNHYGSDHPCFSLKMFLERNYWSSLLMTSRSVVAKHPFCETPKQSGLGFEDWHWLCNIVADQIPVVPVDEGGVFIRRKHRHSRLMSHMTNDTLLPPTPLFRPSLVATPKLDEVSSSGSIDNQALQDSDSLQEATGGLVERTCTLIYRMGQIAVRRFPFLMTPAVPIYWRIRQWEDRFTGKGKVPEWLVEEWEAIRAIEPQLVPNHDIRQVGWKDWQAACLLAEAYWQLCEKASGHYSHILLVPWLKRGGADLEILNYVQTLISEELTDGVLVIGTEDTDSPWADRLPKNVHFVNFGEVAALLPYYEQERLLATYLVQSQAPVVHNLNSKLGYSVFRRFGTALTQGAKLYVSVFCEDYDEQGREVGYTHVELPQCVEFLTAVMADNQRILDRLHDLFAIPHSKLCVHYQPIQLREKKCRTRGVQDELQVLWAARLDRQKRPDVLIEIARRCAGLPIHFHVYGSTLLEDRKRWSFRDLPNVTYHGPFNGFESLPVEKCDVFLNNSQWEGMPNALLEALAVGLPIVTSNVGGISELVRHEETGLLIDPFDDVEQYVVALKQLYRDPALAYYLADQGRQLLAERHSWKAFAEAVKTVPGYVQASQQAIIKLSA